MIPKLEIIVGDDLRQQVWQYWFNEREMCLWLEVYKVMERPSKSHKMKEVESWRGWSSRDTLKRKDVPVPDEVKAEVLAKFRAMITVED